MRLEMFHGSEAAFSPRATGVSGPSKKGSGRPQRPPVSELHSLFCSAGSQSETWEGFVQWDLNHRLCRENSKIIRLPAFG